MITALIIFWLVIIPAAILIKIFINVCKWDQEHEHLYKQELEKRKKK